MAQARSKPNPATERLRQQRLRDRRKEDGWKRLTIWLDPQEADTLAALGDEWMGRTVKALLADAMGGKGQPPTLHAVPAGYQVEAQGAAAQIPAPETFTLTHTPAPEGPQNTAALLMAEVDALLVRGLSGATIAQQFNAEGRRTKSGAEFRGANLLRDWRRWKGAV